MHIRCDPTERDKETRRNSLNFFMMICISCDTHWRNLYIKSSSIRSITLVIMIIKGSELNSHYLLIKCLLVIMLVEFSNGGNGKWYNSWFYHFFIFIWHLPNYSIMRRKIDGLIEIEVMRLKVLLEYAKIFGTSFNYLPIKSYKYINHLLQLNREKSKIIKRWKLSQHSRPFLLPSLMHARLCSIIN